MPRRSGLAGLYFGGIVVAVITARLLRRFLFKKETPFVMELPPYRMPTLKASMMIHTWAKGKQYLKKMGGIILFASIIVWALNYFPFTTVSRRPNLPLPKHTTAGLSTRVVTPYLEMAGKVCQSVMKPLGFEWRATVAAMACVPQKRLWCRPSACSIPTTRRCRRTAGRTPRSAVAADGQTRLHTRRSYELHGVHPPLLPMHSHSDGHIARDGLLALRSLQHRYNTLVAWLAAFATYRTATLRLEFL